MVIFSRDQMGSSSTLLSEEQCIIPDATPSTIAHHMGLGFGADYTTIISTMDSWALAWWWGVLNNIIPQEVLQWLPDHESTTQLHLTCCTQHHQNTDHSNLHPTTTATTDSYQHHDSAFATLASSSGTSCLLETFTNCTATSSLNQSSHTYSRHHHGAVYIDFATVKTITRNDLQYDIGSSSLSTQPSWAFILAREIMPRVAEADYHVLQGRHADKNNAKMKKRFKCDLCDKWFTRDADRRRHQRTTIQHGAIKRYNCDVCNKAVLSRPSDVARHKKKCSTLQTPRICIQ